MKCIDRPENSLKISGILNRDGLKWHSAKSAPFRIHGLYLPKEEGAFRRMPAEIAKATSDDVADLALNTAGGRVRFKTDSPFVAIHAEFSKITWFNHMTDCGVHGFDLYIESAARPVVYRGTFRPPVDLTDGYESLLELPSGGPWEVTINFPLYNGVDRLLIGLQEGCRIDPPRAYRHPVPVVYYGSSITQGGCASRPGNSYPAMISRMLDCDYVNLGFSGSGRGEQVIVDYMAGLPMSAFVCDYDHNAPTAEHLLNTHENLYRTIRERNPEAPIILISRPDVLWHESMAEACREVIRATYEHALARGDQRVSYIDGRSLFGGLMPDSCTVDGTHPNDLGFMRMAEIIGREISRWL